MSIKNKKILSLAFWSCSLIAIGWLIGSLSRPEITTWYTTLKRSPLNPPNDVFPIAWTILYGLIGAAGWVIWGQRDIPHLKSIKWLYVTQLILNWSWTPLFFSGHLVGPALAVLLSINILVALIMWLSVSKMKSVAILMAPYLLWGIFASYLNFYIWWHN